MTSCRQRAEKLEGGRPESTGSGRFDPWLLIVLGPTGTGKSELALTLAGRIGGEIIGCDALQVYRGFDAATAKPTPADRRRAPHHLVDHIDPRNQYTLADFIREAEAAICEIDQRGKVPIIVGGTGLYLRGLLRGIVETPPRDPRLRERLQRLISRYGAPRLHRLLRSLDPRSAERLARGDSQRIVRAVELAMSGGPTWSDRLQAQGTWKAAEERYRTVKIGLDLDSELLKGRIQQRVDSFFQAGLVEEVRALLQAGVPRSANAFKAIGYREVVDAEACAGSETACKSAIKRNTWRFAKRQRTWFRREPGVVWLDAAAAQETLTERVVELWAHRLVASANHR